MKKLLKLQLIFTIIFTIICPSFSYADNDKGLDKYSKSSITIDQETSRVLFEKDADTKRPLASLTKMMTFLIAIESIESKKVASNDIITIDKSISKVRGSSYHLKEGEKIPLVELMKGLMIVSGNDAAVAIGRHIAGNDDNFVKLMNDKAKKIGMISTNFVNCNGLPIYDLKDPKKPPRENISTARDIAKLGKYMFDNYEKQVKSITDMTVYSYPERGFVKNNTNALLGIMPEVDGIKTGYTGNAGYCLAFSMTVEKNEKNEKKRRIIGVTLGANHKNKRLSASVSMLNHGKDNFYAKKVAKKDELIGKKYIKGIDELEVTLKTNNELYTVLANDESLNAQTTFKEIKLPINKGDVLGVIKYYTNSGEVLGSVDIVSANDIKNVSLLNRFKMIFSN